MKGCMKDGRADARSRQGKMLLHFLEQRRLTPTLARRVVKRETRPGVSGGMEGCFNFLPLGSRAMRAPLASAGTPVESVGARLLLDWHTLYRANELCTRHYPKSTHLRLAGKVILSEDRGSRGISHTILALVIQVRVRSTLY